MSTENAKLRVDILTFSPKFVGVTRSIR